VTTARATMTELPATFEAGGIVRARVTAVIASRVMATVTDVHVRASQRVRRGASLVSLDAREMTANRDRAVAAEAAAQESSFAADADVAAAEADLALARATHHRIAELAARKSATPQELDQAIATLTAADARLRSARARRAAASAEHDAAHSASSAAGTSLTYTQLTAPFDAVVSERSVDPGAMATPGTPLLTLEDPTSFQLEVRIDESRVAQVLVGQAVKVHVSNAADPRSAPVWADGRVTEIARLDPASHAFAVKIDLPIDSGARSGSFGRARFSGPTRTALTVPESALVRRGQLAFVFAVDANNIARLRAVSTGGVAAGHVETLAGVSDGDIIVVSPPLALTDGHSVQASSQLARGDGR